MSVSTVGVKNDDEAMEIWAAGMKEAIRQVEPVRVIEYGGDIGFDYNGIKGERFANRVTENWKKR